MKKTRAAAAMAVVFVGAVVASAGAHAQAMQWRPGQHREPDPGKRVPGAQQASPAPQAQAAVQPSPTEVQPPPAEVRAPSAEVQAPTADAQAQPYAVEQPSATEDRGGFFLGVQGGQGRVYEDIEQSAFAVNAGYRWQAGAVTLVGVEVAAGRLDSTEDDGWRYGKIDYASLGANARFNFGRDNPLYGLVRAGYWTADDSDSDMNVDGGYFGLGLGVDISRHFNLSLIYTNHVYFNDYYWEGDDFYYEINRADTLMFGAEVRF